MNQRACLNNIWCESSVQLNQIVRALLNTLIFLTNSLSDSSFESYLRDTHRWVDYRDLKEDVLPKLLNSFKEFSIHPDARFKCANRFEGQFPSIRIQCPVGFVPDVIYIELPHRHETFIVKQAMQTTTIKGLENLVIHLRVLLTIGLAHWQPT